MRQIGQPEKTRVFPWSEPSPSCGMVAQLQMREQSRTSSRGGTEGSGPKGPEPC
jgi:hypothetical protein